MVILQKVGSIFLSKASITKISILPRRLCPTFTRKMGSASESLIKHRLDNIIKSAEDKRLYRGLELTNGLKVLLISDPVTDSSGAALDVHIGSMSDPKDIPGLAHFCEHMLFLGTEKYPEENEYNKFLSEHGGSSNAYTSAEHTNFYFDIGPDHLQGALDRFAQFFLCPLFTASATEREVNAVNSENDKNLSNDAWRLLQLEKATVNQDHDYSKFGTGNKDTLLTIPKERGQDIREELLKFHKENYSSNLMALAILGKESLDELSNMVVPLFGGVENKNVSLPLWPDNPIGEKEMGLRANIVPVKDIRRLNVTWPTLDLRNHYRSCPGHYLGHLIGHEGPGSLLSELKARGWVNNLVGGEKDGARGFDFFIVDVDLTEEGIKHVDDIVTLIFQYINMLKKEGPHEWVHKECADLSAMSFRFKDKEKPRSYVTSTVSRLHNCNSIDDFPMEKILSFGYILDEYKPDLIEMVLGLLTPRRARVAVVGQVFQGETNLTEKWYGTEYSIQSIPDETMKKWENAGLSDKLHLPEKNMFIPTNFDILPRDQEPTPLPIPIRDTQFTRIWYKQDDTFRLPKAFLTIEFTSPYAYMDPLATNLTYMFVSLFRDALTEYSYAAELAGLDYSLNNTIYGLTLYIRGYNHKQHILLEKIIEKMATFKINPKRFDILKENYVRSLKNFKAEQPYNHALYYCMVILSEQMWTKEELLESTDDLTIQALEVFIPQLLSRLYLEMLIYGNVNKDRAFQLADIIEKTLEKERRTKPLLDSQKKHLRELQLPNNCCYLYKKTNEVHKSSSLEIYYQCSTEEVHNNMVLELFCQIISEPCFDILRTQEQLGYIVFSGVQRASGVQGVRIIVQSDKSPDYVESRVEAFLHKMGNDLKELSAEKFDKHINALATKRLEKAKKMLSQSSRYWSEISSQQYNFNRDETEVAHLRTLTKDDIITFYKELIAYDAPKRRKLCIHITSTAPNGATEVESPVAEAMTANDKEVQLQPPENLKQGQEIEDLYAFKKQLGLYPLPKPYIKIGTKSKL